MATVADEDGEWFSYTFPNPATGAVEAKHSWMVKYDGLTFGSGWYEPAAPKHDPPAYTRDFVTRAISLYDAIGRDATVAYYNTPESIDDQWYIYILDQDDMMLAHAANPDLVGKPASAAVGPQRLPGRRGPGCGSRRGRRVVQLHVPESGYGRRRGQALLGCRA